MRAHSLMARSSEAISFGTRRCTVGSLTVISRSDRSCALDSMLRKSWLILLTAKPSAASLFRCDRVSASSFCIEASSRSAVPISSRRPDGVITLVGSSGRSEKRTMFQVSLVIGLTSSASSER